MAGARLSATTVRDGEERALDDEDDGGELLEGRGVGVRHRFAEIREKWLKK